jgi:RimJ/RimL family protein N-acetyltransferase
MSLSETSFNKFFPADFTIETPRVILSPLTPEHRSILQPLTTDKDTWKYFTKDLSDPAQFQAFFEEAFSEKQVFRRMPFVIFDKDENKICGSTSYGNISFFDKRIEIGWTWLAPEFRGTGVNKQAKFGLLCYAFDVMKMERVEIKTDFLNERSKAALLKIGMKPEGVLRSHMQMHSNRRRDTIYFSIIREEWAERKESFFPELL